jgi:hypothetical protein
LYSLLAIITVLIFLEPWRPSLFPPYSTVRPAKKVPIFPPRKDRPSRHKHPLFPPKSTVYPAKVHCLVE